MSTSQTRELYVLPLSADSPDALDHLRAACAVFVRSQPDLAAADLLASAARRRSRAWRVVALGTTIEELATALEQAEDPNLLTGHVDRAHTLAQPAGTTPHALAKAFCEGADVDMTTLLTSPGRHSLPLPTPPLVTRRIWLEETPPSALPAASTPVPPLAPPIVAAIREHAARELGVEAEAVAAETTFLDMGADSLLMVNVLRTLELEHDVRITMRELFDRGDSPAALARLVEERLPNAERARAEPAEQEPTPVAPAQERIWFTEQLHPDQRGYNEPNVTRFEGPLDPQAFAAALNAVVRAQPLLRCRVVERSGAPLLQVCRHTDVEVPLIHVGERHETDVVAEEIARASTLHLDLAEGPLWVARLLRFAPEHHVLVLVLHHIAIDAFSGRCLARELSRNYAALIEGAPPPEASAERRPYTEYAHARRAALAAGELEPALRYWDEQLTPRPAPLELPTDRERPPTASGEGGSVIRRLDRDLTARVSELGRASRATPAMCLTVAFAVLLRALGGQDDVVFGTVVSDQPPAFADTIGLYLNMVPLRFQLRDTDSFAVLLPRTRDTMLAAQEHAAAPFEEIVRRVNPPREPGRTPLVGVTIQFESEPAFGFDLPGIDATDVDVELLKAPFDLTLYVAPRGDLLQCRFEYATALFDRATIEDLAATYEQILRALTADPERSLAELVAGVADADPRLAELERGPVTTAPPGASSVCASVAERVRCAPAAPAAEAPDGTAITYAELGARAELLAQALAQHGVRQGSAVMLALPQDPGLVVAIAAVLMLSAAYVPVDVRSPAERKALVAADCAPAALVHRGAPPAWWPASSPQLELDALGVLTAAPDAHAPLVHAPADAETPAYILYTSGSTGRPKGVTMPYAGLANLVAWHRALHRPARTLHYASPAFDVATQEIVCTLATGGTVVTIAPETRYDSAALARALAERRIERMHTPVVTLRRLVAALADGGELPDLRDLLASGEQLLLDDRLRALLRRSPQLTLVNEYGPTETHAVTRHVVRTDDAARVPIGRPVPNVTLRILDRHGRRVPRGAVGEVCVAGRQVATGYRGADAGRATSFVADPYAQASGERMYRTGDRARWRHDGSLMFGGRFDDQVKVRGNRVEPGEVEVTLRGLARVADVAVVPWTDRDGEQALAAYVVPADEQLDDQRLLAELRAQLGRTLPDYMLPAAWSLLTRLPVNASGKLDRQALPTPTLADPAAASAAPASSLEVAVHDIWCSSLALEGVGVTTSFFDVGGHSLNVVAVVNQINERFGVDLPIFAFFQQPTIRATAQAVQRMGGAC